MAATLPTGPGTIAKVVKKSKRGSKPGERRGGRVAGVPNHATTSLKELAREYTQEALDALIGVVRASDSDAAKVNAANAILDRGYGKASSVLTGGEDGEPIKVTHRIELVGVRSGDNS